MAIIFLAGIMMHRCVKLSFDANCIFAMELQKRNQALDMIAIKVAFPCVRLPAETLGQR